VDVPESRRAILGLIFCCTFYPVSGTDCCHSSLQPKDRKKKKPLAEGEEEDSPYAVVVAEEPAHKVVHIDGRRHVLSEKAVKINFLEAVVRYDRTIEFWFRLPFTTCLLLSRNRLSQWEENHNEAKRGADNLLRMTLPVVVSVEPEEIATQAEKIQVLFHFLWKGGVQDSPTSFYGTVLARTFGV